MTKLNPTEGGIREFIRTILRKKKIRHKSQFNKIWTVCYAQQPLHSIMYYGPLYFSYYDNFVVIGAYDVNYKSIVLTRNNDFSYNIDSWVQVVETKFDLLIPTFENDVENFIDKHISNEMKRHCIYKILKVNKIDNCIPNVSVTAEIEKPRTFYSKLCSWFWCLLGWTPEPIDDFYWKQAIQRHFCLEESELDKISDTVRAMHLSKLSKNKITIDTKEILESDNKS